MIFTLLGAGFFIFSAVNLKKVSKHFYPVSEFIDQISNGELSGGALPFLASFLALILLIGSIYALILHCAVSYKT